MKVKYNLKSNGTLLIKSNDGKTVVINPAWWDTRKRDGKGKFNILWDIRPNSTEIELRDGLFNHLYFGIKRYLKLEDQRFTKKYKSKEASRLLAKGRQLEEELALSLENQGEDLERYRMFAHIESSARTA